MKHRPFHRQAAAIPYEVHDGRVEVMLLTSRNTRRWIIPKGNIEKGETALKAAAAEAFEEAGVQGIFDTDVPVGFFTCDKVLKFGRQRRTVVEVYVLRVTAILKTWREQNSRERVWLPLTDAVEIIQPGALPIFKRLQTMESDLIATFNTRTAARKK